MKTLSRGNHSLSLAICIFFAEVIISGCGSNKTQHTEPHSNQGAVRLYNNNRPASQLTSFISSNISSIASFNYSYNPFSKGEEEVEHRTFKRSAFEWFQKYAKIKRYGSDDSFNIKLKQYNTATQGHRNSVNKDITSKNEAWLLELHRPNSNLQSDLLQNRNVNNSKNVRQQDEMTYKTTSRDYNKYILTNNSVLDKIKSRNKRELGNLEHNKVRHDKNVQRNQKRKKSRKHGRMYFDKKESSTNVTILNGQTALLTCTVRNVGNKSVSWLRHRNPIPQVLGMNDKIYTKDPRFSVIHNPEDPKLKEVFVLRIRHSRLSDGGRYECQVSANSRKKGSRSRAIYHVISLDVVEPITWIVGGPDIYVDRGSTLNVTCVVSTRSKPPDYIIWSHFDRTILYEGPDPDQALPPAYSSHATNNDDSISSTLPTDSRGRFISNLAVRNVNLNHAGEYKCEPAASRPAKITVHVLNGTDQLAVSDNGDEVSSSIIGDGRVKTKLINKQSFDTPDSNKRRDNGAMLKGKHMDKLKSKGNMKGKYEDNGIIDQTDISLGSCGIRLALFNLKFLATGCLLAIWRLLQM